MNQKTFIQSRLESVSRKRILSVKQSVLLQFMKDPEVSPHTSNESHDQFTVANYLKEQPMANAEEFEKQNK